MRFVLVNHGPPGRASICSACSRPLGSSYVRHVRTPRRYCDHNCYLQDQVTSASMPWLVATRAADELAPVYRESVQAITSLAVASWLSYATQMNAFSRSLTEVLLCMRDLTGME
jgi:hypothetical protein